MSSELWSNFDKIYFCQNILKANILLTSYQRRLNGKFNKKHFDKVLFQVSHSYEARSLQVFSVFRFKRFAYVFLSHESYRIHYQGLILFITKNKHEHWVQIFHIHSFLCMLQEPMTGESIRLLLFSNAVILSLSSRGHLSTFWAFWQIGKKWVFLNTIFIVSAQKGNITL